MVTQPQPTVACDTSFLVSLYLQDAFTSSALDLLAKHRRIWLSPFNECEFYNTINHMLFRQQITATQMLNVFADYEDDLVAGHLVLKHINLSVVLREAKRISQSHTSKHGFRSYDILQVAAALTIGVSHFLTFDVKQTQLAGLENLATGLP